MKRQFQVIQVMNDDSERRFKITARNYKSAWRKISEDAMFLDMTRGITMHEIITRPVSLATLRRPRD